MCTSPHVCTSPCRIHQLFIYTTTLHSNHRPEAAKRTNEGETVLHLAMEKAASAVVVEQLVSIWPEAAAAKAAGGQTPLHYGLWSAVSPT